MSRIKSAKKIARHLAEAHKSRTNFDNLIGEYKPESIAHAYECQKALNDIWMEGDKGPVAGYKIALTSKAIQEL